MYSTYGYMYSYVAICWASYCSYWAGWYMQISSFGIRDVMKSNQWLVTVRKMTSYCIIVLHYSCRWPVINMAAILTWPPHKYTGKVSIASQYTFSFLIHVCILYICIHMYNTKFEKTLNRESLTNSRFSLETLAFPIYDICNPICENPT